MKYRRPGGLTLIEICVVLSLVALLGLLSLSSLRPATEKAGTRGLAGAVLEAFEASRQFAIRSGQPVALGMPTDGGGNPMACSLYRLQGWNTPYVTWSNGLQGDYPDLGFAAALWDSAPAPGGPAPVPPSAKYFHFGPAELAAWLPDQMEDDYIFCYLPDGSLITNGLPTSGGRYTVVVAGSPTFSGAAPANVRITSGTEPFTILVSPSGGVEMSKGCQGTSLPAGAGNTAASNPQARTQNQATSDIYISQLKIRPNPSGTPGEGICVPGQVVTLEIFAHCPQGDALFANWTQQPGSVTGQEGSFTWPTQSSALPNEADRMEYISPDRIARLPEPPNWGGASYEPAPGTGIFRAQWTWTVPTGSEEGDLYNISANVQNAKADAVIRTPPRQVVMNPAPAGRLLVERFDPLTGLWQLWRMNPDGSGEKRITPEGMSEMMATLDRHGSLMAYLREIPIGTPGVPATETGPNNRYVMTRTIDGPPENIIDGPGPFTSVSIAPGGNWVSYRNNATNTLITVRTDGTGRFEKEQVWGGSGYTLKKGKSGWSYDGRYLLYGTDFPAGNPVLCSVDVNSPGASRDPDHILFGPLDPTASGGIPRIFSPVSYQFNGKEYVVTSCSGDDSYLVTFEVVGGNYTANQTATTGTDPNSGVLATRRPRKNWGAGFTVGSPGMDEDFPAVSPDGTQLTYTTSPTTPGAEDTQDQEIVVLPNVDAQGVFFGQPPRVLNLPNVRRAIFIPAE